MPRSLSTAGILHNLPCAEDQELNLPRLQNQGGEEFPLLVISHPPQLVAKASPVFTYALLSGDYDFETLGISKAEWGKSSGTEDVTELVEGLTSTREALSKVPSPASNWVWWFTPVVLILEMWRQEDQTFRVILD